MRRAPTGAMLARWLVGSLLVGAVAVACSVTPHPGGGAGASRSVSSIPAPFDPSVPLCPNASGVPPLGALYRQDAVPRGLACASEATCSISVHDCADDWPTCGGDPHVGVYGCACEGGAFRCELTAEGGVACPSGGSIPLGSCCDPAGPNLCERALSDCGTHCDPDLQVCVSPDAPCTEPFDPVDAGPPSDPGADAADTDARRASVDGGKSGCYSDAECDGGAVMATAWRPAATLG